jgi:hypothetical protein
MKKINRGAKTGKQWRGRFFPSLVDKDTVIKNSCNNQLKLAPEA